MIWFDILVSDQSLALLHVLHINYVSDKTSGLRLKFRTLVSTKDSDPMSTDHIMDRNQLFPLEKVKSMVDLGVRFDNNLTFRDHISEKN